MSRRRRKESGPMRPSVPEEVARGYLVTLLVYENDKRKEAVRGFGLAWIGVGLAVFAFLPEGDPNRWWLGTLRVGAAAVVCFGVALLLGALPFDDECRALLAELERTGDRARFVAIWQRLVAGFSRDAARAARLSWAAAGLGLAATVDDLVSRHRLDLAFVPFVAAVGAALVGWALLTRRQRLVWNRLERGELAFEEAETLARPESLLRGGVS